MNPQQQQQAQPKPAEQMSDFERLLKADSKTKVEFTPFGATEKIALSWHLIRKFIAVPFKDKQSGKLLEPDDRQCARFEMLCKARQLNPFEGDAFMIPFWNSEIGGPEWSMITAHNAFLKRAEAHADYGGKESGIIFSPALECKACQGNGVVDGRVCAVCYGRGEIDELIGDYVPDTVRGEKVQLVGGWCRAFYKSGKKPEYQRLKLSTYNKNNRQWNNDAAGQICKCAEAAALRAVCPNTLGGMYLREEMNTLNDAEPQSQMARPIFQTPAQAVPDMNGNAEPATEPAAPTAPAPDPKPTPKPILKPATPETRIGGSGLTSSLRALCRKDKILEMTLIGFLVEIGSVEGQPQSLEEIVLQENGTNILNMVQDQWNDISQRIKSVTEKGEAQ